MTINSSLDILDKQEAFLSPNSYKTEFENFGCFNPECKSGLGLEVHHIVPRSKGGKDESENYIILCRQCHRGLKNHSNWRKRAVILWTYKFYFESKRRFEGANLLELPIAFRETQSNQGQDSSKILLPQMQDSLSQSIQNQKKCKKLRRKNIGSSKESSFSGTIKCLNCGETSPKHKKWKDRKKHFCSNDCRHQWHLKQRKQEKYKKLLIQVIDLIRTQTPEILESL